ncbi:hypothetical protein TWF718_008300 [Orbilia javanica]|uniref:Uncharacterized protein n=1 Tax=Orbilia javanica TaxID=47235 RepID=A0AAN8MWS3_9PEZI
MTKTYTLQPLPSTPTLLTVLLTILLLLQVTPATASEGRPKEELEGWAKDDEGIQASKNRPKGVAPEEADFNSDREPYLDRRCRIGVYNYYGRLIGSAADTIIDIEKEEPERIKYLEYPDSHLSGGVSRKPLLFWEGFSLLKDFDDESVKNWTEENRYAKGGDAICHSIADDMSFYLSWFGIYFVYVSGWCTCEFGWWWDCRMSYDYNHNPDPGLVVSDWHRNSLLGLKEEHWRKPKGIQCFHNIPQVDYLGCRITLGNGGDQVPAFDRIDVVEPGSTPLAISKIYSYGTGKGEISTNNGLGPCERVSDYDPFKDRDGIIMRAWEIHGCTCQFYNNDRCEGLSLIRDGHGESTIRKAGPPESINLYGVIRSFRCERYWGRPPDLNLEPHTSPEA